MAHIFSTLAADGERLIRIVKIYLLRLFHPLYRPLRKVSEDSFDAYASG
jgi:hypothetical protein